MEVDACQLKEELKNLRKYCDDLEEERSEHRKNKDKIQMEYQKNIQRQEEEV